MANSNSTSSNGVISLDELKSDPTYHFWILEGYVSIFSQLVADADQVNKLVAAQYKNVKVSDQAADFVTALSDQYANFYGQTVNSIKDVMRVIQHSYDQQSDTQYTDPADALNEMLRRQNLVARLSLMTDDQLKSLADDGGQGLITLPEYDQQQILTALDNRGIDFEQVKFQTLKASQYKSDPNYQKLSALLQAAWTVTPNGANTMLAYPLPVRNDNTGDFTIKFIEISIINNIAGMDQATGAKAVSDLQVALSFLKGLSEEVKPEEDMASISATSAVEWADKAIPSQNELKVADNDPRINPDSSHWSWLVMYTFLSERFSNNPVITNNPIYSDQMDPNYDIEKRYNMMLDLYQSQKATGEYKPLKAIDTGDENPEEMDDQEIEKVFGKVD